MKRRTVPDSKQVAAEPIAASGGPVRVAAPSAGSPRCESEAMAAVTAVWPVFVSTTLTGTVCPTVAFAGSGFRSATRPPANRTV